jgi:hypothetical protein
MRCSTSNQIKVTDWRTWAQDCLYQRHTQYRCKSISWLDYDPSVNQTAESYFTSKVNKKSKAVRDKTGRQSQIQWCKLKVVTSKHEDFNLMFTNHRKEDGIYPSRKENILQRDSKSTKQRSIIKDLYKNIWKHQKEFTFSTYWRHNRAILKMKLNCLSISTGQGNRLVPLLPSAP